MENFNKVLLNDLNTQTALLEALEWEDDELQILNEYLEIQFSINQPPSVLLENVKKQFNNQVYVILKQHFAEIYTLNGYYLKPDGGDIEHWT